MDKRVNYLIAASAHRYSINEEYGCGVQSKEILRDHLRQLRKVNTKALAQITIIRALPLVRGHAVDDNYYWQISTLAARLSCPVVVIDVPDAYFSYSSWVHAVLKYRNKFDYYILCEDDYYASHKDFVQILVDLHKKKLPKGGYLNGLTIDHAAVSNGIVDARSFIRGVLKYTDPIGALSAGAQRFFGSLFFEHMADYTDEYRSLGWFGAGRIIEHAHVGRVSAPKEDIFLPIQYLGCPEEPFSLVEVQ